MRKMVMAALRPLQASFVEAGTGLEAIEKLALETFEAITLDLNMPDMHGLEVLSFVRNHQAYQKVPVLVVSTRGEDDTRTQVLAAGATAYLTKPFTPRQILDALRPLLVEAPVD